MQKLQERLVKLEGLPDAWLEERCHNFEVSNGCEDSNLKSLSLGAAARTFFSLMCASEGRVRDVRRAKKPKMKWNGSVEPQGCGRVGSTVRKQGRFASWPPTQALASVNRRVSGGAMREVPWLECACFDVILPRSGLAPTCHQSEAITHCDGLSEGGCQ